MRLFGVVGGTIERRDRPHFFGDVFDLAFIDVSQSSQVCADISVDRLVSASISSSRQVRAGISSSRQVSVTIESGCACR